MDTQQAVCRNHKRLAFPVSYLEWVKSQAASPKISDVETKVWQVCMSIEAINHADYAITAVLHL